MTSASPDSWALLCSARCGAEQRKKTGSRQSEASQAHIFRTSTYYIGCQPNRPVGVEDAGNATLLILFVTLANARFKDGLHRAADAYC